MIEAISIQPSPIEAKTNSNQKIEATSIVPTMIEAVEIKS